MSDEVNHRQCAAADAVIDVDEGLGGWWSVFVEVTCGHGETYRQDLLVGFPCETEAADAADRIAADMSIEAADQARRHDG